MSVLAYAIFDTEKQAARAVDALVENDFTMRDICVLLREGPEGAAVEEMPMEVKTAVGPGMAIGAAVGAVGGALVAIGSGLVVAGPFLALLQGAVGGGAAGMLTGFLAGLGYWHDAADFPHHKLKQGAVLVGIMSEKRDRIDVARATLKAIGAKKVHVRKRRGAVAEVKHKHV
jgi:hypothetical protein